MGFRESGVVGDPTDRAWGMKPADPDGRRTVAGTVVEGLDTNTGRSPPAGWPSPWTVFGGDGSSRLPIACANSFTASASFGSARASSRGGSWRCVRGPR